MANNQKHRLEDKIKGCKQLIIQNMEKTIKSEMIWVYLKDKKVNIRNYQIKKDGVIHLEFPDHEQALEYYRKANFKDSILVRPLNIYFKLELE